MWYNWQISQFNTIPARKTEGSSWKLEKKDFSRRLLKVQNYGRFKGAQRIFVRRSRNESWKSSFWDFLINFFSIFPPFFGDFFQFSLKNHCLWISKISIIVCTAKDNNLNPFTHLPGGNLFKLVYGRSAPISKPNSFEN